MAGDGTTRPSAAARQSAGSRRTSGPVADAVKSTRMTRSRLSTAWVQRPSAPAFALPGGAPTPGYRKPMSVPTRDLTKSCHFGSPTRCGRSVSICINAMMNTITALARSSESTVGSSTPACCAPTISLRICWMLASKACLSSWRIFASLVEAE